jgi:hypothetical protein
MELRGGRGVVGEPVAPRTSDGAWGPLGTQNFMAAKPKHKRKKRMG